MLNGIAQDIYHHPTGMNFYESNCQVELKYWAERRSNASPEPNASLFAKYALTKLNWKGMECSMDLKGCKSKSEFIAYAVYSA
jgi:hypothetical protein